MDQNLLPPAGREDQLARSLQARFRETQDLAYIKSQEKFVCRIRRTGTPT
jgi:hypothetical protein